MGLDKVLKLRKSEQSNEKIDLDTALKLRKAKKYIKRTGSPGHYKYTYTMSGLRGEKKERKPLPKTISQMQEEVRRKKPLPKTLAQMQEEVGKKKPKSSKEYMKEHAGNIRKEADELRRMSEEDFKRKKEKYDKKELAIKKEGNKAPPYKGGIGSISEENKVKKYARENEGKIVYDSKGRKYTIGEIISSPGDPDYGMPSVKVKVLAFSKNDDQPIVSRKGDITLLDEVESKEEGASWEFEQKKDVYKE